MIARIFLEKPKSIVWWSLDQTGKKHHLIMRGQYLSGCSLVLSIEEAHHVNPEQRPISIVRPIANNKEARLGEEIASPLSGGEKQTIKSLTVFARWLLQQAIRSPLAKTNIALCHHAGRANKIRCRIRGALSVILRGIFTYPRNNLTADSSPILEQDSWDLDGETSSTDGENDDEIPPGYLPPLPEQIGTDMIAREKGGHLLCRAG